MCHSHRYTSLSSPVFSSFPRSINETDSFLGPQSTDYNGSPDLGLRNVKMNGKWSCNLGGEKNTQEETVLSAIIMVIVMHFGNAEEGVLLHGRASLFFLGDGKLELRAYVFQLRASHVAQNAFCTFCYLFNFSSLWPCPSCNSTTRPFSSTHPMISETSALYYVPVLHVTYHFMEGLCYST